ncbi:MAG: preprotein translocase subunit YajC [Chlamydiota bacterium]|nr:preprotein translocase subunit YajC [Chlamydiota bacterium]
MADAEGMPPQQGMVQTLVMIGIAVLFFYIILWRPEQKRRKALEEQRSSLKKGDRITAMGIIGTVDTIKEHSIILKNVDGSKIEILAAAISDVHHEEESSEEANS